MARSSIYCGKGKVSAEQVSSVWFEVSVNRRVWGISAHSTPHASFLLFVEDKVEVNALPSALVPLVVVVIVLPPFDTTVRPVALYDPTSFLALVREGVGIHLLNRNRVIRCIARDLDILAVVFRSVAGVDRCPSACSPVVLTFTPPSDASRVIVRLLTGIGAGVTSISQR